MDRNLLLATALSMLLYTGYLAWHQQQQAAWKAANPTPVEEVAEGASGEPMSTTGRAADDGVHGAATDGAPQAARIDALSPQGVLAKSAVPETPEIPEKTFVFENDRVRVTFSNRGAAPISWQLLEYEQRLPDEVRPIELLRAPAGRPALATPFSQLGLGDLSAAVFSASVKGDDEIEFVLRRGDVTVRKLYSLDLDRYAMDVGFSVENGSTSAVSPTFEVAWRAEVVTSHDELDYLEEGLLVRNAGGVERRLLPSVGSPGFFARTFSGAEDGPEEFAEDIEWFGVELKYFVSVLLPDEPSRARVLFDAPDPGKSAEATLLFDPVMVAPGQTYTRQLTAYLGPKRAEELSLIEASLIETIDLGYSWFVPLTRFFQWLLHACYQFIPNYGWAIILITIGVRLVTAPIMARQMKSMERMRALQPRLKEIQEKFKDDRQKQSEEMMKMYRETGVNPLGGCFPMLLQFPVFIGLFFALQSSIDLRHAPFMLWINDLSAPETLFTVPGLDLPARVLPIAMGLSMFIQQRMTPMTGMDPAQARMMLIVMPIMMTVLFYQFPSGLVLYWMVSNILGIAHQLWVRKNLEPVK